MRLAEVQRDGVVDYVLLLQDNSVRGPALPSSIIGRRVVMPDSSPVSGPALLWENFGDAAALEVAYLQNDTASQ